MSEQMRKEFEDWIDSLSFKELDDIDENSAWQVWQASKDTMKWISVEESFPVEPEQVICCYIKPIFGVPTRRMETMYFSDGEGWRYWLSDKLVSYPVTHWMPLPAAPEVE